MQKNSSSIDPSPKKSSKLEKSANDLIPELILKINKYSSKLKDRVKLYSIFREFDTYAHINLQNFIKLSDKRYRSIKSGNNLHNVLSNQKKECTELSNEILTNKLYSDKNIEIEEEHLCKKINNKDSKELYQIRHDIIEKTKDLTKNELKKREKYIILAHKSRNQRMKEKNQIEEQNKNITTHKTLYGSSFRGNKLMSKSMMNGNFTQSFGNKFFSNKNNEANVNEMGDLLKNNNDIKSKTFSLFKLDKEKDMINSKKEFLDNLVKKDNKNINDYILEYKLFLSQIKNSNINNLSQLINDKNNFGKKFSFNAGNVQLLSYQEEKKETVKKVKKEAHEVNMNNLIKYTKRGNRKWFLNNIKEVSQKRQNSFRKKINQKKHIYNTYNIYSNGIAKSKSDKNIFEITNNNNGKISEINDNNNFNNGDITGKTSSTTFSNFRNTIKTVKNEANNIRKIGQNFDIKRKTMAGFFKRMNLPQIKEIKQEEVYKTRNNFRKIINDNNNINKFSKTFNINSSQKQKNGLRSTKGSQNNLNVKNELINQKIFADLQRTYDDKKKIWEKEDLMKENIKKEKMSHINNTKKYLEQMAHFKRKPHLFIDPYSKRDELINNRIKLFTRSLSGFFCTEKKYQNRIDEFNNYIEQKENEIKSNDKKMAETLKKEKSILDETDEEFQLKQKMKKNLENEEKNKKEEIDIKLNYKFIPTLKATKKKNKNKSYKDYQEFFEIVKNKQKNGEYSLNEIEEDVNKM